MPRLDLPAQFLQQSFVADHEQRLRRRFQQVEELPLRRARVDSAAVGQQLHAAAAAGRFEQPDAELVLQDARRWREAAGIEKPALAQIGENEQLEQLDRRVAALGVSARRGSMRRNRRRQQTAGVPQLQLPRRQTGHRGHLAGAIGLLQSHLVIGNRVIG